MSKFKEYLLENDIKSAKAKAKGLTHVSFDNYKDSKGTPYKWNDTLGDFKQSGASKEQKDRAHEDTHFPANWSKEQRDRYRADMDD